MLNIVWTKSLFNIDLHHVQICMFTKETFDKQKHIRSILVNLIDTQHQIKWIFFFISNFLRWQMSIKEHYTTI